MTYSQPPPPADVLEAQGVTIEQVLDVLSATIEVADEQPQRAACLLASALALLVLHNKTQAEADDIAAGFGTAFADAVRYFGRIRDVGVMAEALRRAPAEGTA